MSDSRKERVAKWFANAGRVLRDAFTGNLHIKLLSLALAFVIWPIIMLYTNPMRTRRVEDVYVRVENMDIFNDEYGLTTVENISDLVRTVEVWVSVEQEKRSSLTASTVRAVIDMRQATEAGVTNLNIDIQPTYGTPVRSVPATIAVTVERLVSKTIPVKIVKTSPLEEGYREVEEPYATPDRLTITGAESVVNAIQAARFDLDYTKAMLDIDEYSQQARVTFVDENNEPVANIDNLSAPDQDSVIVKGRILPTAEKTISIDASSFAGTPLEGYELILEADDPAAEVTHIDETVTVVAPRSVLDSIADIPIEPVDINDRSASFHTTVSPRLPDGVEAVYPTDLGLYVVIKEIRETRRYVDIPIEIRGEKEGTVVVLSKQPQLYVDVEAPRSLFQRFQRNDVVAYIDVNALTLGDYSAEIHFEIIDSETGERLLDYTVTPEFAQMDISIIEDTSGEEEEGA